MVSATFPFLVLPFPFPFGCRDPLPLPEVLSAEAPRGSENRRGAWGLMPRLGMTAGSAGSKRTSRATAGVGDLWARRLAAAGAAGGAGGGGGAGATGAARTTPVSVPVRMGAAGLFAAVAFVTPEWAGGAVRTRPLGVRRRSQRWRLKLRCGSAGAEVERGDVRTLPGAGEAASTPSP